MGARERECLPGGGRKPREPDSRGEPGTPRGRRRGGSLRPSCCEHGSRRVVCFSLGRWDCRASVPPSRKPLPGSGKAKSNPHAAGHVPFPSASLPSEVLVPETIPGLAPNSPGGEKPGGRAGQVGKNPLGVVENRSVSPGLGSPGSPAAFPNRGCIGIKFVGGRADIPVEHRRCPNQSWGRAFVTS